MDENERDKRDNIKSEFLELAPYIALAQGTNRAAYIVTSRLYIPSHFLISCAGQGAVASLRFLWSR